MAKILLIEDDPLVVKMYRNVLSFEGFKMDTAPNGVEGLKKAKEFAPDLIFLDIMMPKMNGIQVLDKLKSDPKLKDIPVIVLTNLAGADNAEEALKKGAFAYMVKSEYKPQEVAQKAREYLDKRLSVAAQPTQDPAVGTSVQGDSATQAVLPETPSIKQEESVSVSSPTVGGGLPVANTTVIGGSTLGATQGSSVDPANTKPSIGVGASDDSTSDVDVKVNQAEGLQFSSPLTQKDINPQVPEATATETKLGGLGSVQTSTTSPSLPGEKVETSSNDLSSTAPPNLTKSSPTQPVPADVGPSKPSLTPSVSSPVTDVSPATTIPAVDSSVTNQTTDLPPGTILTGSPVGSKKK